MARDTAALLAARSGLTAAQRVHRGRLLVITLHRVLPASLRARYPYPGLVLTPEELDWLLASLAPSYTLGPLAELHDRHQRGERPARPFLAITFDDGQRDNVEHARPVLARHGVRATFFVPVEAIDRHEPLWHDRLGFAARARGLAPLELAERAKALDPVARDALVNALSLSVSVPRWAGMMRWTDVRALATEGHEIGSHSMSHPILPQCDDGALRYEIERSRAHIEAAAGVVVRSFCYPNGDWDPRALRELAAAGYRRAVTTRFGTNPKDAPPFTLRRCDIDPCRLRDRRGALSPELLQLRLSGLHPRA